MSRTNRVLSYRKFNLVRKVQEKKLCEMKYVQHIIWVITFKINPKFGEFYKKYWNPINYAIIGGTGVIINMTILLPLSTVLPLWLANLIAIFCAWTWNWSMSVGPFGYLWGFKEKEV